LAAEAKRLAVQFARVIYDNASKDVQTSFDAYDQHYARMALHAAIDALAAAATREPSAVTMTWEQAEAWIRARHKDAAEAAGDPDFEPPLPADWLVCAVMTLVATHEPSAVPEKWKLVPIEPTPGMVDAAQHDFRWKSGWAEHAWGLMLAAAPHPSAQPAEPVAWKCVEDGLPEDGELVLCEFEEDALTKQGFKISDGYMLERWSVDRPVAGVIRWIRVNKIPDTLAELEALDALKYLATGVSLAAPSAAPLAAQPAEPKERGYIGKISQEDCERMLTEAYAEGRKDQLDVSCEVVASLLSECDDAVKTSDGRLNVSRIRELLRYFDRGIGEQPKEDGQP
jgi:hypothetical protein